MGDIGRAGFEPATSCPHMYNLIKRNMSKDQHLYIK